MSKQNSKKIKWKAGDSKKRIIQSEYGSIQKEWKGRIRVALVYPNTYYVGMSNLGFQTVYDLLNKIEHVVCERSFLPEKGELEKGRLTTLESEKPFSDFDIIAFSISFENDFPNLLSILKKAGLPFESTDRRASHPLVIAGGVTCLLNPEPIAPFIDCFLIGEAEAILYQFVHAFDPWASRKKNLENIARTVSGVYVPAFYKVDYNGDGTLRYFRPVVDVPARIDRAFQKDSSQSPTCSTILTPHTTFENTFLIEATRGCPHGCRFCAAGFVYRPPRFKSADLLEKCMEIGMIVSDRIGLVGTAVSDLAEISRVCDNDLQRNKEVRISFSSFRADALTPEFVSVLKRSRVKTAAIAPDAGSERMRLVINKGISEEDVLNGVEILVAAGIPNIRLYFMVGLPTETMDDVDAIITLSKRVKKKFLLASRSRGSMGRITISLNPFIPKPFTPFQWAAMEETGVLRSKIKKVKEGLNRVANVRVSAASHREAYIQAILSRGDRRIAALLLAANRNGGNWTRAFKESSINPEHYNRERDIAELLPWGFINHGIKKSFLIEEYGKAKRSKASPPCRMESCSTCGICREE